MASALTTLEMTNYHHGPGLVAAGVGTAAGFAASVGVGTLYGWKHKHWYGKYSPYILAGLGKAGALALALMGHYRAAIVANDIGQAGVNAVGLNLGVKLGLKLGGESPADLLSGYTAVAGELPPAASGRALENLSVEDFANLN